MTNAENRKEDKSGKLKMSILASRGIILSFIAGIIFSGSNVLIKKMINIFPGQLALYQFWATASFTLPDLVYNKRTLFPTGYRVLILIVAFSAASDVFLCYVALRFLPLGEATVLISSYPVFVTLVARICLKETLGLLEVTSALTTIIGIILTSGVCQTLMENSERFTTENIYGLVASLVAVSFTVLSKILVRKLKNIHSSVFLFTTSVVGVVQTAILTPAFGGFTAHYRGQEGMIILLGILSFSGTACVTISLKYAEAGPASTMNASSEIFFSFLWQVLVFGEIPDIMTVTGAVLVCISAVLLGFSKQINAFLPEKCITLI